MDFNDAPIQRPIVEIDPEAVAHQLDLLFGYCETVGRFIALRGFHEAPSADAGPNMAVAVPADAPDLAQRVANFCNVAYQRGFSAFIVPGLVNNPHTAKEGDVVEFGSLFLDLDETDVDAALARVTEAVGTPSLIVNSGGVNSLGQPKTHVYWRLTEATADVARVGRLRAALARAVGGDPSFGRITQPVRIVGSVHCKTDTPRPVEIVTVQAHECELDDLAGEIEALSPTAPCEGNLSGLGLDFSTAATRTDSREAFDRVTREGGVDGITRHDDMTQAMGHAIAGYRAGTFSLEFAQDIVRTKNSRLVPPWPEERLAREWGNLLRKDFKEKGPVPAAFPDMEQDDEPFSFADLAGVPTPQREWLVENFISPGTTTALFGEGGIGKSMLALHMGLCVSHGKPFMGIPTKKARVFGLFCEDDQDELRRRMARFCAYERISVADTRDIRVWPRDGKDNFMTDEKGRETEFYSKFWAKLEEFQGDDDSPILVIIDTAAHVFGGNEIVRREVTRFVATQLGRIAKRFGPVLLLAHPSKSGIQTGSGDSGSTGWHGSVRSRAYMHPTEDKKMVVLDFKKANYGKKLEPMVIDMKDGVFNFVRQGDATSDDLVDTVMDAMRAHEAKRGADGWKPLSPQVKSQRNPWTILAGYPGLEGVDKDIIRRAYEIGLAKQLCKIVTIEGARPNGQTEEVIPA